MKKTLLTIASLAIISTSSVFLTKAETTEETNYWNCVKNSRLEIYKKFGDFQERRKKREQVNTELVSAIKKCRVDFKKGYEKKDTIAEQKTEEKTAENVLYCTSTSNGGGGISGLCIDSKTYEIKCDFNAINLLKIEIEMGAPLQTCQNNIQSVFVDKIMPDFADEIELCLTKRMPNYADDFKEKCDVDDYDLEFIDRNTFHEKCNSNPNNTSECCRYCAG